MAQPRLPETTDNLGVSLVAGEVSLQLPSPLPLSFLLDRWCFSVWKAPLVRSFSCCFPGFLVRDGLIGD